MRKIPLILISFLLFNSCKDDDMSLVTDPYFISFFGDGAEWQHIDSLTTAPPVDEDWLFRDTLRLGNQVRLLSSFVNGSNIGMGIIDTLTPMSRLYYEVLARSSFGYKPINSPQEHYKYLYTEGEEVSGWVRFDEDSLRLYSLRKKNDSYFEYLMIDYSCEVENQWVSPLRHQIDSCEQINIHGDKFKLVYTNIERFASGIHLVHHSHLWQEKYPYRVLKSYGGIDVSNSSFKLLYNGKIYILP